MRKRPIHYFNKNKRLICALIVLVFTLVTVLEPVAAVAVDTNSEQAGQTQTQVAAGEESLQTEGEEQSEQTSDEQDLLDLRSGDESEDVQTDDETYDEVELDYEDSANSWRFDDGQLIEQEDGEEDSQAAPRMLLRAARASYTAWGENSSGQYVNSKGDVIDGAYKKGIDVSEWQGKINWAKVKKAGIDFAIIRCGYGSNYTKQDDKYWEYNVSECERLNIPYGVYLYSYANTISKAKSEAKHTLRLLKGHTPSYPVYYDLEDKIVAKAGNSAIVKMANTYCSAIESSGYAAGIYANKNWWTSKLNSSTLNKYEKWVAQWYKTCTYSGSYRLWQCTSSGYVNGISGRVDLNFEFKRVNKTASLSLAKKSGKTFELNSVAGQSSGQYSIVQGSCTDGTYGYYILYNKSKDKCRILKCKLSNNAKVKLSGVLKLNHGNDVTYNSNIKRLVVTHYTGRPYRLTLIDPATLKVKSYKDIKVPTSLDGASASELKAIKGFSDVAYSSARKQYVLRIKSSQNYLILDANMAPVKYVKVSKKGSNTNQGIDVNNAYIFALQSKKGSYNTVLVYDWTGKYQYRIKLPTKHVVQSIFHKGSKFYAATYKSYYKKYYTTHYKTKKVKWKKVNGKWKYKKKYVYKTVKYKVKWKKVNGRWKYKTKTKKVRVTYRIAHKKLVRKNYVYKTTL